jgi:hypothetical protein
LAAYREQKTIVAACQRVGLNRSTVYEREKADPEFAAAMREIYDETTDELEISSLRRAIEGWLEPVYYLGAEVGQVRKFCTTREIFHLKARRRAVYNVAPLNPIGEDDEQRRSVAEKARAIRLLLDGMESTVPDGPPAAAGDDVDSDEGVS